MPSLDTREKQRDSLFFMIELIRETGEPAVTVKLRNLSAGGMMVEGDVRVKRGERVAGELHNIGPVAGTVVWTSGRRLGIAFDDPVDPRLVRTKVYGGHREAPVYARAALDAPRHGGWNGKLRRI